MLRPNFWKKKPFKRKQNKFYYVSVFLKNADNGLIALLFKQKSRL